MTGQTTEHRTSDAEGQLIKLTRPSLHVIYGYDALGRRAWRKTDAGTTTYLWHNDVLLGEQSPNGDWQWYLRDPQTDEPLLTLIEGQPYYYELDHRMMPIRLWDQSGQKVWEGHADAWGNCQPETLNNRIHQPLRLPGQFEDELTGIVQNRFRDYDPGTGRYLTPDPLGIKGGLNSYRYTKNPIDYVDPLGLENEAVVTAENVDAGEEAALPESSPEMAELQLGGDDLGTITAVETTLAGDLFDSIIVTPTGNMIAKVGSAFGLFTTEGGLLVNPLNDTVLSPLQEQDAAMDAFLTLGTAGLGTGAKQAGNFVEGAVDVARKAVDDIIPDEISTLFRRDNRGPEVIFEEGFQPRRSDADVPLEDYVNFNEPSQYVGTSKVDAGAARC